MPGVSSEVVDVQDACVIRFQFTRSVAGGRMRVEPIAGRWRGGVAVPQLALP